MEESLKCRIQCNFYSLVTNTTCSKEFLSKFKAQLIFSVNDLTAITAVNKNTLPMDQAYQFYRRILLNQSCSNVFSLLLFALKDTDQQIAYEILLTSQTVDEHECPHRHCHFNPESTHDKSDEVNVSPQAHEFSLLNFLHSDEPTKNGENFESPPEAVRDFLNSRDNNILLLKCIDTKVTTARIMDTMKNVDKISLDLIKYFKSGKLFLATVEEEENISEIIENLDADKRKFIFLHERETIEDVSAERSGVSLSSDSLKWDELTPSYKTCLVQKLEKICGAELDSELISPVAYGASLTRLIRSKTSDGISLLGEMVEQYWNSQVGSVEVDSSNKDLIHDLGRITVKMFFPLFERKVFPRSTGYKNEVILGLLVSYSKVLIYRSEYEIDNEYVALYHLAKFLLTFEEESRSLRAFLLGVEEQSTKVCGCSIKYYEFHNRLLAYFINYFIKPKTELSLLSNQNLDNITSACISGNFTNLLALIFSKLKVQVNKEMLFEAIKLGNPTTTLAVYQAYARSGQTFSCDISNGPCFLHAAVLCRKLELIRKLLNEQGFIRELGRTHHRNLIHFCVRNTMHLSEEEVAERGEVVIMLFHADNSLISEKRCIPCSDQDKFVTPLMCENIHFKLIKILVSLGADVYVTDNYGNTMLRYAVEYNSPQQFHDLVKFLIEAGIYSILKRKGNLCCVRDNEYKSIIHYLVIHSSNVKNLHETVKTLLESGAEVNARDNKNRTPLFYARKHGRLMKETIKLLEHYGGIE